MFTLGEDFRQSNLRGSGLSRNREYPPAFYFESELSGAETRHDACALRSRSRATARNLAAAAALIAKLSVASPRHTARIAPHRTAPHRQPGKVPAEGSTPPRSRRLILAEHPNFDRLRLSQYAHSGLSLRSLSDLRGRTFVSIISLF